MATQLIDEHLREHKLTCNQIANLFGKHRDKVMDRCRELGIDQPLRDAKVRDIKTYHFKLERIDGREVEMGKDLRAMRLNNKEMIAKYDTNVDTLQYWLSYFNIDRARRIKALLVTKPKRRRNDKFMTNVHQAMNGERSLELVWCCWRTLNDPKRTDSTNSRAA